MHDFQRRKPIGRSLAVPKTCTALLAALLLSLPTPAACATAHSFIEEFTSTTYKDAANTTADWSTAAGGKLQLFPFQPTLLGTYNTPDHANNVAISGNLAYVADYNSGLQIVNVSNPASPTLTGSYNTPGTAEGIAVSGTVAYVADGASGLQVLNVSNPASPTLLGTYNTPGFAHDVVISGTVAYVADGASGLQVLNVSNPASPVPLGSYNTPGNAWSVAISGSVACVADGATGLVVLNVGGPASPALLGTYNTPGDARGVAISGTRAYVADGGSGLQIINVSNPASPTLLGSYDTPGTADDIAVSGSVAYVTDEAPGVHMIDVGNPASPSLIATYNTPGTAYGVAVSGTTLYVGDDLSGLQVVKVANSTPPGLVGSSGTPAFAGDVAVSGTVAYVADGSSGLQIFDVTNPSNPAPLGGYVTPHEANGVAVSGTTAYVAAGGAGLVILDVRNPVSPTLLGSYVTSDYASAVTVSGTTAYVADGPSGLVILNVSNPASPSLLGSYNTPGGANALAVSGTTAYVADGPAGLVLLNVSNPASPSLLGSYDTPSDASAVVVSGAVAYVADYNSGLQIVNVSNPASPALLGSYGASGSSIDITVSGSVAYLLDWVAGLQILDVSNPASPTLIGSQGTLQPAGVAVSGELVYVADGSKGLKVFEVAQNRFDLTRNVGRSLAFDNTSDLARRGRVTSTQVNNVAWELTADGGATWQAAVLDGWVSLIPGSDLRWRATVTPVPLTRNAIPPEVSRVQMDWLYDFAAINSITDVPGDQGGWLHLRFSRSAYDFADVVAEPIAGYQIYRRLDNPALVARLWAEGTRLTGTDLAGTPLASIDPAALRRPDGRNFVLGATEAQASFPPGTWEVVSSVFATQSDEYTALVPTTADSTASGPAWSVYLVTAHTTTPSVWYTSYADSGKSVDNLAPSVPTGLVVLYHAGTGVELAWGSPVDADFRYFKVYRSTNPNFTPGPADLVQSTIATNWTDANPGTSPVYYKLSAVDFAGNESGFASTSVPVAVEGTRLPARFALYASAPNPFRQTAVMRYDVPASGGKVRLVIYDLAGRQVRSLVEGAQTPGEKQVVWDGRDDNGRALPSGVYLYRMQATGFSQVRKILLVR